MITHMEKLTVDRKNAASVFTNLATEAPLTPNTMSEAASLVQEIAYLDRKLASYNGKQPLMSARTKPKSV